MSQPLISKLAQVRRKQAIVSALTGICLVVGAVVLALGVEMLIDWGVEWPWAEAAGLSWTVRAAILAVILAGAVWIILNKVISPWVFGPDDETLALAVERDESDLRGRLIAAVQLSRPEAAAAGASKSLIGALVRETEDMVRDRDFDRIIRLESLVRMGSIALLILITGGITYAICRPGSALLLRRAFLSNDPVPRKTLVIVVTRDVHIPKGESVTIVAQAEGVKPARGTIEIRYGNAGFSASLDPDPDVKGQYFRKIEKVTQSFTYTIRLNDGRSDRAYKVDAVDRPSAESMDCAQIFPEYINHEIVHHLPGDLSLVAGSRLVVTVQSNKPLARTSINQYPFNRVHLAGSEKDYPLTIDPSDPKKAVTELVDGKPGIPLPAQTTGLAVYLVDTDGIETKDPTTFRVELVPDKAPFVKITSAQTHEALVTRVASPHVTFDAYDDYALGRVTFRYTVDGGPQQEMPIALTPEHPQAISGSLDVNLATIPVPTGKATLEGSTIEYWLHAEDQNTVSNPNHLPGSFDTDHFVLKVVTEDEKRRELMGRVGIIPDQLTPITTGQQQMSDSLGNMIVHGDNSATTKPGGK